MKYQKDIISHLISLILTKLNLIQLFTKKHQNLNNFQLEEYNLINLLYL